MIKNRFRVGDIVRLHKKHRNYKQSKGSNARVIRTHERMYSDIAIRVVFDNNYRGYYTWREDSFRLVRRGE